jgi:hypothetical protein
MGDKALKVSLDRSRHLGSLSESDLFKQARSRLIPTATPRIPGGAFCAVRDERM